MIDKSLVCNLLEQQFPTLIYKVNANLQEYTSMKVGGIADIMIFPNSIDQFCDLLSFLNKNKIFIIGKGSNLIVNDKGVKAIFFNTEFLNNIIIEDENCISAECGVSLEELNQCVLENQLTGLEFSYGIPGSVGGAVYMNAGAYGGEIKDILIKTLAFHPELGIITLTNQEHNFTYRKSIFAKNGLYILKSTFQLKKGKSSSIINRMLELINKRQEKQPLELPSAGSIFKRPEGYFVGKLIMDAGIQGHTIGGAMISMKHAGFIVNIGNATANDILELIFYIQNIIYDKFNVKLEPEVKFLEEDGTFKEF